jgi:4-hydroxythreonine-4-phosphate dehydrogenase
MRSLAPIAVTIGEPAGIGPDLCVRLAMRQSPVRLVAIGDSSLLRARARRLGSGVRFVPYSIGAMTSPDAIEVIDVPLAAPVSAGRLDAVNAGSVLRTLDIAIDGCLSGEFSAMVTAPVQKSVINAAGISFTGHTEYLAERTKTRKVVMMLVGGSDAGTLRVALVTTHLPLAQVPGAVTKDNVMATVRIVASDLVDKFALVAPRIALCGLNPHAGEGGYLGREEIDAIEPAIAQLRREGVDLTGPMPADTVFVPRIAAGFDCIVAMYHDQGLPVLKHASFGHGVNVTLGLPIVRTSVDHGTALDLAGEDAKARDADPKSMFAAVDLAVELAKSHGKTVLRTGNLETHH